MKKLEIGNFHIREIRFGEKTAFSEGVLTVNKQEAIACLDPAGKLKNIELHIVRPGESVRLIPAKAAVEPRFRPDGRATFPGYTGPIASCGEGVVYAMKGMSVIACGKYANMVDGLVDMSGPAAEHSVFSQLINLVVYAERRNEKDLELVIRAEEEQKLAAYLLADYVAQALEGQEPEDWERFSLEPGTAEAEAKGLPRAALFMTLCSQLAPGCNDMVFGGDCGSMLSMLVHPNEVLDGRLVSKFGLMGQGSSGYAYQNQPLIKRLYQEHGKTINFMGVVLCPADVSDDVKLRVKISSGEIASLLRLDAAIVAEWGGGSNIDLDFFYHLAELEARGIKTVGLMAEHGGKMMQDQRGDAIVSGGDTGAIIELPPMERVIGDIESAVRDSYYGSWPVHDEYGPSLRPDGSLIVNTYMIGESGNIAGFFPKTVREY